MYQKISTILEKIFRQDQIFKHGFNYSPMYKRSTGKLKFVSRDLHQVKVEIPVSWKNRNYVGSIFGGSLFSATDPIYMIQLVKILGPEYVVWDKSATIKYRRPAKSKVYVNFEFSKEEINEIKSKVATKNEFDLVKEVNLMNDKGDVFAELEKTMYIASKEYYKTKRRQKLIQK